MMNFSVMFKVYNDADILEKIMKDRRRDLGPATDDDDMMSPKLKISKSARFTEPDWIKSKQMCEFVTYLAVGRLVIIHTHNLLFDSREEQHHSEEVQVLNALAAEAE